jgi:DNA-binding transcriptional ArsR family regulator
VADALENEIRRLILDLLEREGVMTPSDIALRIERSNATTSHHLARLLEGGHVVVKQVGPRRFYSLPGRATGAPPVRRTIGIVRVSSLYAPGAHRPEESFLSIEALRASIPKLTDWSDEERAAVVAALESDRSALVAPLILVLKGGGAFRVIEQRTSG